MCRYRYIYYSRCQHAECYKVSSCDRAIEFDLPQRDNHYSRGSNVDCARPPEYPSSASTVHLNSQHFIMSTLTPTQAGGPLSLMKIPQHDHLDHAALIPRSARHDMEHDATQSAGLPDTSSYRNVNIAIPLDSPSSLSMELTHDGKVTELVARFETYNGIEHSEASQRPPCDHSRNSSLASVYHETEYRDDNPTAPATPLVPVPIAEIESATDRFSSSEGDIRKQRKPLPSEWTQSTQTTPPARRGAPLLQTELRSSERVKRKSAHSSSPTKTLRRARGSVDFGGSNSFLTKEKSKPTSPASSAPCTPGSRLPRKESKPDLSSLPQSSLQGRSSIHFASSSAQPVSASGHRRSDSLQSTGNTEFFSARQSPITVTSLDVKSRPRAPKLSLTIPAASSENKTPFTPGSASTAGSGSPTRSRIPRMHTKYSTVHSSPKSHSTLRTKSTTETAMNKQPISPKALPTSPESKEPQSAPSPTTPRAVRHVKTVDSTGATPVMTRESLAKREPQPDTNTLVRSYLKLLPDQVPPSNETSSPSTTTQPDFKEVVGKMLSESVAVDRLESPTVSSASGKSMIFAQPTTDDAALKDPAVIYSRKRSTGSDSKESTREDNPIHDAAKSSEDVTAKATRARGRSPENVLHDREQTPSGGSPPSNSTFSELRPTAAEFVPSEASQSALPTTFLPFDPFAIDSYGMPWLYHMYPVSLSKSFTWFKSPRKSKTAPRGRKHGTSNSSPSPQKILGELQKFVDEADTDPLATQALPFASQLEEVARNVKIQTLPVSRGGNFRSPRRYAGNGLYDNPHGGHGSGIPIDQTAPFPDPVPPSGSAVHVGQVVEKSKTAGCRSAVVDAAFEWVGGSACNKCEPDH